MKDDTRRLTTANSSRSDVVENLGDSKFFLEMTPGMRFGGRYIVKRFLGQGAMGVVVEAEDADLGTLVAAKILRPILASSRTAQERFRQEITIARRVTHPNVCRIYDLGHHLDRASGLNLPFLTMELLDGPTLSQLIAERERLSTDESLQLLKGIVAGLTAAHKAGVVHRDFKSSNVIIVDGSDGLRPVVTDFGLSLNLSRGTKSPITLQGQVLGTPAFISPEQLSSAPVTSAADIYALGIVMYQMVTGELPFLAKNPITTAMLRLQNPPPPPTSHVSDLSPRWEATILHCLEKEAEDRPSSAEEVLVALDPSYSADEHTASLLLAAETSDSSQGGKSQVLTWLPILLLLLVLLWMVGRSTESPRDPDDSSTSGESIADSFSQRPRLAVASLTPLSDQGGFAWIGSAVAEMLTTEVAAIDSIRTVPRNEIHQLERNQSSGLLSSLDLGVAQLQSLLATRWLVRGTFITEGSSTVPTLRIDVQLHDTSNDSVTGWSEIGMADQLIPLVQRLGNELRQALGTPTLNSETHSRINAEQPSSAEVARLLTVGPRFSRAKRWRLSAASSAGRRRAQSRTLGDSVGTRQGLETTGARSPSPTGRRRGLGNGRGSSTRIPTQDPSPKPGVPW